MQSSNLGAITPGRQPEPEEQQQSDGQEKEVAQEHVVDGRLKSIELASEPNDFLNDSIREQSSNEEADDEGAQESYGEEDEEVAVKSDSNLVVAREQTILDTVSAKGGSILEQSMQALGMMFNLDQDSCIEIDPNDSILKGGSEISKLNLASNIMQHPEKFVNKKTGAGALTKKSQQLQRLIMHANGSLVEAGGRETFTTEQNANFNYKKSIEEGTYNPNQEEQHALNLQPLKYTIYLRNMAQTVSRSLAGVDEIITGLDTTLVGGKNATANYLNQRYTIPQVRQQMCQGLASKAENPF